MIIMPDINDSGEEINYIDLSKELRQKEIPE